MRRLPRLRPPLGSPEPCAERNKHARRGSADAAFDGSSSRSPHSVPDVRRRRKRAGPVPLRRTTTLLAAVLALLAAITASAPARGADHLCVIVDPVVAVGCTEPVASQSSPSRTATQGAAQTVDDAATVRKTSTTPRYDPSRLTVTWKRDATPRAIAAALAKAHVTVGLAIRSFTPTCSTSTLRAAPTPSRRCAAPPASHQPDSSRWPTRSTRVERQRLAAASRSPRRRISEGVGHHPRRKPDRRRGGRHGRGSESAGSSRGARARLRLRQLDSDPRDDEGHGTAVAGIIAARSDNRQGVTASAGCARSCRSRSSTRREPATTPSSRRESSGQSTTARR